VQDSVGQGIEVQKQTGLKRSTSLDSFDFATRGAARNSQEEIARGVDRNVSNHTNTSYGFTSLAGESIGITQKRMEGGHSTRRNSRKPPTGDFLVIGAGGGNDGLTYPHSPLPVGSPRRKVNYNIAKDKGDGDDDDDDSFSLTPPSSEDENLQVVRQREISALSSMLQKQTLREKAGEGPISPTKSGRRASTGMVSTSRFASLAGLPIDEDVPHITTAHSADMEMDLGPTLHTENSSKFRKRLGIRRSIDFSGETLEICRRGSTGGLSMLSADDNSDEFDEPDYLRASAILDAILRAADVGHYFQSWDNMIRWSSRMYFELLKAHNEGRGHDPHKVWFDNQIRIMDSYLRPLALQLDESGVFGEFTGAMFVQALDDIKDRWLMCGHEITEKLQEEAALRAQGPATGRRRNGMKP